MEGEAQTKANNFNSCIVALYRLVGEEPFKRVRAALTPETRALVDNPPLSVKWVPTRHFAEVIETAGRLLFGGDEGRIVEWSRQAVRGDLRTVYKVFIRLLSPTFVIERAAKIWSQYTKDNGTMRAVVMNDHACEVHYAGLGADVVSPMYWAWQRGTILAAADATGVKDVRVETVSGGGRSRDCVVRATWK